MKIKFSDNRRTFIKRCAAVFGGVGALLVVGRQAIVKPKQPVSQPGPSGQGYRLTEHIKRYYETARL
jgi:hypothetical protein